MAQLLGVLEQGLIYAVLALGVYITFKILDFPDMTVDSTFPLGAAVTALMISAGINPLWTLPVSLLAGAAAGAGGSSPAGLVAMGAYAIEATRITGALPAGVAVEDAAFAVSGRFAVPICAPLPVPMLREVADRTREAVPVEAQGSTARATIAGKSFDVKGATAIAGPDGTWEVRLTAQPHGCADKVPGDLVVGLRVDSAKPKLYLGGNWIAGAAEVTALGGSLKVMATPSAAAVALTLDGEMDYTPVDVAYRVALTGAVTATVCTRG